MEIWTSRVVVQKSPWPTSCIRLAIPSLRRGGMVLVRRVISVRGIGGRLVCAPSSTVAVSEKSDMKKQSIESSHSVVLGFQAFSSPTKAV